MEEQQAHWAAAVKSVIEAEHAAADFYRRWMAQVDDDRVASFLMQLVAVEEQHAFEIEARARAIALALPVEGGAPVDPVEVAPGWQWVESLEFGTLVSLAIEAERQASRYYRATAQRFTGEAREFFESLAREEDGHATMLESQVARLLPSPSRD